MVAEELGIAPSDVTPADVCASTVRMFDAYHAGQAWTAAREYRMHNGVAAHNGAADDTAGSGATPWLREEALAIVKKAAAASGSADHWTAVRKRVRAGGASSSASKTWLREHLRASYTDDMAHGSEYKGQGGCGPAHERPEPPIVTKGNDAFAAVLGAVRDPPAHPSSCCVAAGIARVG